MDSDEIDFVMLSSNGRMFFFPQFYSSLLPGSVLEISESNMTRFICGHGKKINLGTFPFLVLS